MINLISFIFSKANSSNQYQALYICCYSNKVIIKNSSTKQQDYSNKTKKHTNQQKQNKNKHESFILLHYTLIK